MSELPPHVRPPTRDEVRSLAARQHLHPSEDELDDLTDAVDGTMAVFEALEQLAGARPPQRHPTREVFGPPDAQTDPHNAFVVACAVQGADGDGSLAGLELGIKDNVAVAGLPMTCGSPLLEDYVSASDATVTTRLLDAGATIVGKLNMEHFAISASGEQSLGGPVRNPRNPEYLAGGSSSGAGAAVAAGDVDAAIGTDTGGSIRIPAAWCGVVGLKPTYGLVPFTGIVGMAPTMDHCGPLAGDVETCARVLDAVAGDDPLNPRARSLQPPEAVDALDDDPSTLSVGLLSEGFGHVDGDERVDETVREALAAFGSAGATVDEVSVPWHTDGPTVHKGIVIEGLAALWRANGLRYFSRNHHDVQLVRALGKARRVGADALPPALKANLVAGEHLDRTTHGRYYATALNLARDLTAAYDVALESVDVLALPTSPLLPHAVEDDLPRGEIIVRGRNMIANTTPFNVTGHPALSVPCGTVDGLPVGVMLVGRQGDDATVIRAGYAFEQAT